MSQPATVTITISPSNLTNYTFTKPTVTECLLAAKAKYLADAATSQSQADLLNGLVAEFPV